MRTFVVVLPALLVLLVTTAAAAAAAGLAYSSASNETVQRQPTPGSCHATGTGQYSRPDPRCTPGALNPQVTQATIGRTICRSGWTATVRPPESVTEREKVASMAAYGDRGSLGAYEYDHFVPLELGGATNDPRNLWPEPGASPNPKDELEFALKERVCDGRMTLAHAQQAIVGNWVTLARQLGESTSPTGTQPGSGAPKPKCSAHASYNSRYSDFDVYVNSNQPDQSVTVTAADGKTATWHTNGSGYADVYFHAGSSASGERVTVRVGRAACTTNL
jgi:hypothetical protein